MEYNLVADSGTIRLIVLSANNDNLASRNEAVSKGKGKATLEADLSVPNTAAIEIVILLLAQGQTATNEHDRRSYRVKPR